MARGTNKLSARGVQTLKTPGRHSDGGGLYLHVDPSGAKRWVFVFQWNRVRREMGLGPVSLVGLADARDAAAEARKQVRDGVNPVEARRAAAAAAAAGPERLETFGEAADKLIADLSPGWRNPKHRQQWTNTLRNHAAPLRPKAVATAGTEDVVEVLQPIWLSVPDTARRLRGRIERVFDSAKARGKRTGENPARWRGHLSLLLPAQDKLRRGHHAALPHADMAAFMALLRGREGRAAAALEFAILTAARTIETRGARWEEIDLVGRVWNVPAERMKMKVAHRVPLTDEAVAVLERARPLSGGEGFVFPGLKDGKMLSDGALERVLDRMGRSDITVHGFRSTFRSWAGAATSFPRELSEMSLAHVVGDDTERAYLRDDLLERRRPLMKAWAGYCGRALSAEMLEFRHA